MVNIRSDRLSGNPDMTTVAAQPPDKLPRGPAVITPGRRWGDNMGPVDSSNDTLVRSDRHAYWDTGTEKTGRESGRADVNGPGQTPARPTLRLINRTINPQQGTFGASTYDDDLRRPYSRTNNGRFFLGQQDGTAVPVYGGTPGLYSPYGSYAGYTTGDVKGIQSPVPYGSPQDQPQSILPGPPHGLHTATFPSYSQTLGYYMAIPAQMTPTVSRPYNSRSAGQSYSQLAAPLGQAGTVAGQAKYGTPRTVGYQPGSNWRG